MKNDIKHWDSPVFSECLSVLAGLVEKHRNSDDARRESGHEVEHLLDQNVKAELERGAIRYNCSLAVFHSALIEWYAFLKARGLLDLEQDGPTLAGLQPAATCLTSAIDVFAMDTPLPPDAEGLWNQAMAEIERARRDPANNRLLDINL